MSTRNIRPEHLSFQMFKQVLADIDQAFALSDKGPTRLSCITSLGGGKQRWIRDRKDFADGIGILEWELLYELTHDVLKMKIELKE